MSQNLPSLPMLVDAVTALTVGEGVALLVWHRVTGRGISPRDFLLNMVSGLCLMLALRLAVGDAGLPAIALALFAAGAAHATDLALRWRRASAAGMEPSSSSRRFPRSVSP